MELMHKYNESRYKARKKYYDKEENKEKKRIYMREYSQRPHVKARSYYSFKKYKDKLVKDYLKEQEDKKELEKRIGNELLHMENSTRFVENAGCIMRTKQEQRRHNE
jgi:hypothetical protein